MIITTSTSECECEVEGQKQGEAEITEVARWEGRRELGEASREGRKQAEREGGRGVTGCRSTARSFLAPAPSGLLYTCNPLASRLVGCSHTDTYSPESEYRAI